MAEGRILIVEDEHIVAMGIKRMLKSLGYTVTGVASSGKDAISKAESTFPDLILMDIMLKGELDGVEAAKEIKERFDVPIVYLTAYSDSNILERVKKTGPSGYIVKPFDEKDLYSNIEIALHRSRKEKKDIEEGIEGEIEGEIEEGEIKEVEEKK
ncbi:response regulator [Methanosarcina mazei]|jgi:CheY-like chemotaxis protein|nr:response regulator [Methanosarcina mazei]AKB40659.1 response regulator receiver [Methanosarcina mazei WWM610]AKB61634.1 response regulator receiver [Methanosarcina mazei SarPi]AKB64950.1 response regulator receiver [Methanosarcina mazei S-6]AKB67995.1 response regulator receiver [Methanosarcina mazei LYC]AKB71257.1 response regulator receiver [Methanosarcina mazei C16]